MTPDTPPDLPPAAPPTEQAPPEPPLRGRAREAQGNDGAILQAAREVFLEQGWGAPMSAIAARAGTGVATIYRRYPAKTALVNALQEINVRQIIELARAASDLAGSRPATSAVESFLSRMITEGWAPLMTTLGRHVEINPELVHLAEDLEVALEAVVNLDRTRGFVPEHYGPADVMLTLTHLRPNLPLPRERADEIHLRELRYLVLGLRAAAQDPTDATLPGTPSTWPEWVQLNNTHPDR